MDLDKSKTKQNLMTAYLRESGATNEYSYYAEQAKQEGYQDIYNTYTLFSNNEKAHAKVWFSLFHGIGGTLDNLKDAMDLEHYERTIMYDEFAMIADSEGFTDIADKFRLVASVERAHEEKYKQFLENVKGDKVFDSDKEVSWICLNCGHIHTGKTPPTTCPLCSYPISYFKILV